MSDFVVKIDTARLNNKQAAALAGAIQGAVHDCRWFRQSGREACAVCELVVTETRP